MQNTQITETIEPIKEIIISNPDSIPDSIQEETDILMDKSTTNKPFFLFISNIFGIFNKSQ